MGFEDIAGQIADAAVERAETAEEPELTAVMNFRIAPVERELLGAAAEYLRITRSAFMRTACVEVALAVVARAGGPGAVADAARQRSETRLLRAAAAVNALAVKDRDQ